MFKLKTNLNNNVLLFEQKQKQKLTHYRFLSSSFKLKSAYLVKLVNTIDLKSVPCTGYRFKSDSKQLNKFSLQVS